MVLPAGVAGALVSHWTPDRPLRLAYVRITLVAAGLMLRQARTGEDATHEPCEVGEQRELQDSEGKLHRFCAHGLRCKAA